MCDPVTGTKMAISVIQAQQAQHAADAQARATNAAADEANQAQLEAYNRDMGSYFDEEVDLIEEGYQSAEDAAEAKMDLLVEAKQKRASLEVQNLETIGGGQTADAIIAQHTRALAGATRDLEDNFQRGVTSRERQMEGMQRDKVNRRYSAISSINQIPRTGFMSQEARAGGMIMAGVSGYATGKSMTKVKPAAKNYKRRTVDPRTATHQRRTLRGTSGIS